ncbi:MAG TPA: TetR/AcrR family transcriptional regulator, partial [Clostridia bacterium]|nr:TetR/AcrR family transcriptional regulator [Clostridia bacterium]
VKNTQDDDIKFFMFNKAFCRFALEYPKYSKVYAYFRSGKFDISNNKDISIDAKEIDEFTKEIFEMTVSEIKISIEDRTFRFDINPVVLAVLVVSIGNGISDMSPFQREILETHGITMQQFLSEATNLLNRMFINTEDRDDNTCTLGGRA